MDSRCACDGTCADFREPESLGKDSGHEDFAAQADIFDDAVLFEEFAAQAGKHAGHEDGRRAGIARGYTFGLLQGADFGSELGFMRALSVLVTHTAEGPGALLEGAPSTTGVAAAGDGASLPDDRARSRSHILRLGHELRQIIDSIPLVNQYSADSSSDASSAASSAALLEDARRCFKRLMSLAGLPRPAYQLFPAPQDTF